MWKQHSVKCFQQHDDYKMCFKCWHSLSHCDLFDEQTAFDIIWPICADEHINQLKICATCWCDFLVESDES